MALQWTDKVNNVDIVDASDINNIAHELIDTSTRAKNVEYSEKYYGEAGIIPSNTSLFTFTVDQINRTATLTGCAEELLVLPENLVIPAIYTLLDVEYKVNKIGTSAFSEHEEVTSIIIPNTVTEIGQSAFLLCTNVMTITIPDSVLTIGNSAFSDMYSLRNIKLPKMLLTVNGSLCYSCDLRKLEIPENVTIIKESAFGQCGELSEVIIPDSVTEIEDDAFDMCYEITDVFYGGSVSDWNAITIGTGNTYLTGATIHYNYKPAMVSDIVDNMGVANGIATLDANGKLTSSQAPSISYVDNAGHATTADTATNATKIINYSIAVMTETEYASATKDANTFYYVIPDEV